VAGRSSVIRSRLARWPNRGTTWSTRNLLDIEHGETKAAEQLLPLVYDELRMLAAKKLAHEKPG
jgi:hypothetical protein